MSRGLLASAKHARPVSWIMISLKSKKLSKLPSTKARRTSRRNTRRSSGATAIIRPVLRMSGISVNSGVPNLARGADTMTVTDSMVLENECTIVAGKTEVSNVRLVAPQLFTRVAYLSSMYDQARLDSLSVTYMPMFGTSIPGMVAMYFDYNDSSDPPKPTFAPSLLASGAVVGPIYKPLVLNYHPQDHGDTEFGSSTSALTFRPDNKFYGLHISLAIPSENPQAYGFLLLRYRVTMKGLVAPTTSTVALTSTTTSVIESPSPTIPIPSGHMSDTIQNLLSSK